MEVIPYIALGDYLFGDDFKTIESKLTTISFEVGEKQLMNIKCKTIYIEAYGLLIAFKEDAKSIDYFESTKPSITYQGISILQKDFDFLKKSVFFEDDHLIEDVDGFRSDKFGIGVYSDMKDEKMSNRPKSVIVYSKGHYDAVINPNDLVNFYLNNIK